MKPLCVMALLSLGACTGDLTQIMVVVGTDIDAVDEVQFTIEGLGSTMERSGRVVIGSPATLALVHRSGPLGPVTVTAQGYSRGTPSPVTRTAHIDFRPGEIFVLRLDLVASCLGITCPSDQTCTPDGCRPRTAAVTEPWTGTPRDLDGSVPSDGGPDAPVPDAGVDADAGGDGGCSIETCNEEDDDCNGVIDDLPTHATDRANCGACGMACDGEDLCDARVCSSERMAIGLGAEHSCATNSSGDVYCWGSNAAGQIGDGTMTSSATPVAVNLGGLPVVALAGGDAFTCALRTDGAVWCWGDDGQGQQGNGSGAGGAPSAVDLSDATALCAGAAHACAIAGGSVHCWGRNMEGQLGQGSVGAPIDEPSEVTLTAPLGIACGARHSCALLSGGTVWCWGANDVSQLARSPSGPMSTPIAVALSSSGSSRIASGEASTCVIGGTGQCWGHNDQAQLGIGNKDTVSSAQPVSGLEGAVWLALGADHGCAVFGAGAMACWGDNATEQLGTDGLDRDAPSFTLDFAEWVRVDGGRGHTCGRRRDGSVWCWGRNGAGQTGRPTSEAVTAPGEVTLP